jgi:hypothetical protein
MRKAIISEDLDGGLFGLPHRFEDGAAAPWIELHPLAGVLEMGVKPSVLLQ